MKKPVIGIPGSLLTSYTKVFHGLQVTYTPQGFIQALLKAGAIPLIFPIAEESVIKEYLEKADALLLAGGQDVSPRLYNEEPHKKLGETSPKRDHFEISVVKEAWNQHMPILGVCRGMQVLNVAFGGSLYQDLDDFPSPIQHLQLSKEDTGTHSVTFASGSWLSGVYGNSYHVNSFHHQGIKALSEQFRATAWSKDRLVEGFESIEPNRKVIGLQWHPELMVDSDPIMQSTFDAFVQLVANEKL